MKSVRQSFTLVELMVAMSITALLVVIIAQLVSAILISWTRGSGRLSKNMDARAAMELIVQDIQSTLIQPSSTRSTYEWLRKDVDTGLTGGSYTANNVARLMFFSTPTDRGNTLSGNVCAVGYRLGYEDPITAGNANSVKLFGLYRTLVDAPTTFNNVLGQTNLWDNYWKNQNMLQSTNFLIPHVIDFRVICHVRNPDGSEVQVPHDSLVTLGCTFQATPAQSSIQAGAHLEALDVSLKLISEETATKIRNGAPNPNLLILENSLTYVRRVQISYKSN